MGTLVNVLGAERTGSTMMDVVLGNEDRAFSCGEVMYWYRPYRKHNFILDCSCGNPGCDSAKLYVENSQSTIHNSILNKYKYSIDSSKNLIWVVDNLKYINAEHRVVNVVMWKRIERLLYSHWKRKNDIEEYVTNYFDYYSKLIEMRIPFVSVNYDDFVSDPEPILERLCSLLGMKYSDAKLKFWEGDHHFLFGSHGIRQQVLGRSSYIYKDEPMPSEFERFLESDQLDFLSMLPVKSIFDELEGNDVMKLGSSIDLDHSGAKIKKPYWYYVRRARRAARRYFPAEYEIKDVNPIYGEKGQN